MFEQIVENLAASSNFPQDTQKWCQQWCRMVNTGNDRENLCHPYGLLIASASQSNPGALQKMIDLMWGNDGTQFTASPQSSLKTAVGTLLAIDAPLQAHVTLITALKNHHQKYWSQSCVSKRQAMNDDFRAQTLASVMDHMAHAYLIPIENKLSAVQLSQLFECAGPVFVERFAHICGSFTPSDEILSAFDQMSSDVSSRVMLRLFKSYSRTKKENSLMELVSTKTSIDQIVDLARAQDPDDLHTLEVDRSNFAALCETAQHTDYRTAMDKIVNHRGHSYAVVQEVVGVWMCLLELYPHATLSPTNTDVLQKFMHYCGPQQDLGVSQNVYSQLQNALLRSQANTVASASAPKTRKI